MGWFSSLLGTDCIVPLFLNELTEEKTAVIEAFAGGYLIAFMSHKEFAGEDGRGGIMATPEWSWNYGEG